MEILSALKLQFTTSFIYKFLFTILPEGLSHLDALYQNVLSWFFHKIMIMKHVYDLEMGHLNIPVFTSSHVYYIL